MIGTKEQQNSEKTINKMSIVSPQLTIIILNINELNSLIKKNRMSNRLLKKIE